MWDGRGHQLSVWWILELWLIWLFLICKLIYNDIICTFGGRQIKLKTCKQALLSSIITVKRWFRFPNEKKISLWRNTTAFIITVNFLETNKLKLKYLKLFCGEFYQLEVNINCQQVLLQQHLVFLNNCTHYFIFLYTSRQLAKANYSPRNSYSELHHLPAVQFHVIVWRVSTR